MDTSHAGALYKHLLVSCTVRCNRYQASVLPKHLRLFFNSPLSVCGCAVHGRGWSELAVQADPDADEPLWGFAIDCDLEHVAGVVAGPTEEEVGDSMQELLTAFGNRVLVKSFRWTFANITVDRVTLSPWLFANS